MAEQQHAVTELPVWPENMAAVRVFSAGLTQWRMGSLLPVGLDFPAVFELARRLRLRCGPREVQALQVMEAAALEWFAERAKLKG